ncbi:hypothetical protein [Actinoplanes subtropicus]|uniref:hypothetical protein n=1 Tax=Actinoplanes subtropicus TaxID=543632 RepID=UPI0004C3F168|nr:hypothetical protein [Actinoplanes subtropicus]
MGELADRIDTMRVRASTLGDGITAELRDGSELSISFREGYYRLFDYEADMERQLEALAAHLWVARGREVRRIFTDVTDEEFVPGDPPSDERDLAWQAEREELVATGSSSDGRITVRVVGFRDWQASIRPGTLRALDEHRFAEAVAEAAGELIRDLFDKLTALSSKYYGDQE